MTQAVDATQFKQVLSHFVSGVTVVTARSVSGEQHGMTCSAFMSISVDPPLVSVCLTAKTRTEKLIRDVGFFVVNVLAADQAHVADRFAGRHKDKNNDRFDGLDWAVGRSGMPVLKGTKALLECHVVQFVEAGDHTLIIGKVIETSVNTASKPLVYYKSGFVALAPQT